MIHPFRRAHAMWQDVLGIACVVADVQASLRSFRATRTQTKELAGTERTAALLTARRGCTHSPTCPPTAAPDRAKAEVIYEDAQFLYLCNGLILSTRGQVEAVPDFPPADLGSTPTEVLFP